MRPATAAQNAVLLDFLGQFHEDSALGQRRPLGDYLRRFPGYEEGVAREFLSLVESAVDGRGQAERDPAEGDVGPYRLLRQLGGGGQGAVYLAEDLRLRRQVVVKVLHGALGVSDVARRRFRLEADLLASLNHPHICRVLDADLEGDVPYLAMPHVPGETLAALLRRGDPHPGLAFFEATARALHAAHEAGVLHRDVKPANLLVTQDAEPLLLDFGLAQEVDGERLTLSGDLFGTLAYLPPERVREADRAPDRSGDVYALGVTLVEALTGELPYAAESFLALEQALREGRPRIGGLPPDLKNVCRRAIEVDPRRRYASALDLAEELARVRRGEPVLARPQGPVVRAGRWVARYPRLVLGTLSLVFVLATALGVVLGQRQELELQALLTEVSEAVLDFVLDGTRPSGVDGEGHDVTILERAELLAGDPSLVWARLPQRAGLVEAQAAFHRRLGRTFLNAGQEGPSEDQLSLALELFEGSLGEDHEETALTASLLSQVVLARQGWRAAFPLAQRAYVDLLEELGWQDRRVWLAAHNRGTVLQAWASDPSHPPRSTLPCGLDELFESLETCLRHKAEHLGPDDASTQRSASLLDFLRLDLKQDSEALQRNEDKLGQALADNGGVHDDGTLVQAHIIAIAYFLQGNYDRAIEDLETLLPIKERLLKPDDTGLANGVEALATVLLERNRPGDLARARPLAQRNLELRQQLHPPDSPHLQRAHQLLESIDN